ncbi:periodic tryptophan protein 2 homolog [Choristoneura fumiferana]|uniref:periodic tryptophan protein 2 homolog n=1 Tax=Choristoneura fumiferana TaxID=7141 RepID=UPI003D155191
MSVALRGPQGQVTGDSDELGRPLACGYELRAHAPHELELGVRGELTRLRVLCVLHSTRMQIAVSTLDGNITFFDPTTSDQTGSVEGRTDLGAGRGDKDLITAKKMLKTKAFTTICYSADGTCILGAGNSKHVCLYSVREAVLI